MKTFNDANSLQENLACLNENRDQIQDYHVYGRVDADTSERIGESSSRTDFSVRSINSALNMGGETGFEDIGMLSTDDFEIYDVSIPCSPYSPYDPEAIIVPELDNLILQTDMGEMVVSSHMNEVNAAEQIVAIAEPEVVQNKQLSRKWKKLLGVSRWFWIRKKISRRHHHMN